MCQSASNFIVGNTDSVPFFFLPPASAFEALALRVAAFSLGIVYELTRDVVSQRVQSRSEVILNAMENNVNKGIATCRGNGEARIRAQRQFRASTMTVVAEATT